MNSESFREEAATSSRADRRRKLFGHLFSGRYESLVVDGPGSGDLKSVRDSTNEKLQTKNGPSAYACIFNFEFSVEQLAGASAGPVAAPGGVAGGPVAGRPVYVPGVAELPAAAELPDAQRLGEIERLAIIQALCKPEPSAKLAHSDLKTNPLLRRKVFHCAALSLAALRLAAAPAATKPNIVVILSDDYGCGSVGCYSATGVKTPNIDRLASEGRRFTHADAPGPVCSPTRYDLMTGRYYWRTPVKDGKVLPANAPLHIETNRLTLASLCKSQGYRTAGFGKWHLGLTPARGKDWSGPLRPGPLQIGFDYYYGMAANIGSGPHRFIEDEEVPGHVPGRANRRPRRQPPRGLDHRHQEILAAGSRHGIAQHARHRLDGNEQRASVHGLFRAERRA